MHLETNSIYSIQDVIDHLDVGGTLDFNEEYALKIDSFEGETPKAWIVMMDDNKVFVAKSKSDYNEGDDRIDINGWMLATIIKENLS